MSSRVDSTQSSSFRDFYNGMFGGVTTTYGIMPLVYGKNIEQLREAQAALPNAKPIVASKNPRDWYRGSVTFATLLGFTTAMQSTAKAQFNKMHSQDGKRKLSDVEEIVTTFEAGAVSGGPVNFVEGGIIYQHKNKVSFPEAIAQMYKAAGMRAFTMTLPATCAREGGSAAAFFGIAPWGTKKLQEKGMDENSARIISGAGTGAAAAALTQPFDSYKTKQQGNLETKIPMMQSLFKRGAYDGFKWRVGIFTVASIVIPWVSDNGAKFYAFVVNSMRK